MSDPLNSHGDVSTPASPAVAARCVDCCAGAGSATDRRRRAVSGVAKARGYEDMAIL